MTVYLDASVLVALFTADAFAARAEAFLHSSNSALVVSDFAGVEFASAVSRLVRTRELRPEHARTAFSDFGLWAARSTSRVEIVPADMSAAQSFLTRLDLTLRTGDAINIAIAQRLGASLATFDVRMGASARTLAVNLAVIEPL